VIGHLRRAEGFHLEVSLKAASQRPWMRTKIRVIDLQLINGLIGDPEK